MAHRHVRVNIQLLPELKEALLDAAASEGESLSEFLRRSAQERLERLRRAEVGRQMQAGYEHLAAEHALQAAEWEAVDLEGWE